MPVYDFKCTACGKKFTLTLSFAEHKQAKVKCPKCRSRKVRQQFSSIYTKTSRKS